MRSRLRTLIVFCVCLAGCGPSEPLRVSSDAATEFHLQSADGFPVGEYKATVLVNGEPVAEREFRVER